MRTHHNVDQLAQLVVHLRVKFGALAASGTSGIRRHLHSIKLLHFRQQADDERMLRKYARDADTQGGWVTVHTASRSAPPGAKVKQESQMQEL